MWGTIEEPSLETPRTSRQYGTKGMKNIACPWVSLTATGRGCQIFKYGLDRFINKEVYNYYIHIQVYTYTGVHIYRCTRRVKWPICCCWIMPTLRETLYVWRRKTRWRHFVTSRFAYVWRQKTMWRDCVTTRFVYDWRQKTMGAAGYHFKFSKYILRLRFIPPYVGI